MFRKWLPLVFILCFSGCTPAVNDSGLPPATTNPTVQPESMATVDETLQGLADDFISLRTAVGQFNGGSWNPDVDEWQGPKHSIMLDLGQQLGNGRFTCNQLTNLLQPPDHSVQGGDPLHEMIQTVPVGAAAADETTQFLVYEWRGTHDFLFFVCEDGRITAADWWYARE